MYGTGTLELQVNHENGGPIYGLSIIQISETKVQISHRGVPYLLDKQGTLIETAQEIVNACQTT